LYESYRLCLDMLVPKPAPTDWVDDNAINLGWGRASFVQKLSVMF
jgi:hypothetical protein